MKNYLVVLFLMLFLATGLLNSVEAHGTGQSVEEEVDGYVIDIGYDSLEEIIESGELVRFDFNLESTSGEEVDFTSVWVRISPETDMVFASHLALPEFGLPAMSYVFPKEGKYELTARFYNENEILVETFFPLTVTKSPLGIKKLLVSLIVPGVIGFIAGFTVALLVKKRRVRA